MNQGTKWVLLMQKNRRQKSHAWAPFVSDPGKGVCADPVDGGAILERGGPDPHSRDRERQLAPDKGRGKT
jgi:hypothetical protein